MDEVKEDLNDITKVSPSNMDVETMPLNKDERQRSFYASLKDEGGGIILYCCHGNKPGLPCCQNCATCLGRLTATQILTSTLTDSGSHCHQERQEGLDRHARNRLLFASALCLVFMIGEIAGGYLANSLAIATDAAHLLTDFASFMISLMALWIGSKPATRRMSFGWYRAEVIGALTSVLLIWVVTAILVYMAVQRVISGDYEIQATIMLITASIGVLVNIIMGVALKFGGIPHGHSHGHSHSHGSSQAEKGKSHGLESAKGKGNINVRAAFIHVVGDFIQSVGVVVAAIIIYFRPDLGIADPICTFLFSILVLCTTFAIMRETINVLMEGIPRSIDFLEVQRSVSAIPGVVRVHNLRIWSLSLDKIALSAHIAVDRGESPSEILKMVSTKIRSTYEIFELTLQIEEFKEEMDSCKQCRDLV